MSAAVTLAPAEMRVALVYERISMDREHDEAGVERQHDSLLAFAASHGWTVGATFRDNDQSAFRGKVRPGYEALLAAVRAGEGNVILVSEVSRLTRHPRELEDLVDLVERHGVDVRALRAGHIDLTTSGGRAVARILGAMARMEAEQMGERVRAKHAANARAGKAHGGPRPFGYKRGEEPGTFKVVPAEAAILAEAARRALAGESVRAIASDFTARQVPTTTGATRWSGTALVGMLRSPRIAGLRDVAGEVVGPGTWDAIVPEPEWRRLRAILDRPAVGRRPRVALLAGLVVCGLCGSRMATGWKRNPGAAPRRVYSCRSGFDGGCDRINISAEPLEALVAGWTLEQARLVDLSAARDADAVLLLGRIADDEAMLSDLAEDFASHRIGRAEWLAARTVVDERLSAARTALGDRSSTTLDGVGDLAHAWPELDFNARREAVRLFVAEVTVGPAGRPGPRFNPDRVTITAR